MKKQALFICGSLNQTSQLVEVAGQLPDVDAWFAPFYGDEIIEWMRRHGLIEITIGGNKRVGWCLEYLEKHGLSIDQRGARGGYDLVVTASDMLVPRNVRGTKLVVIQEGILDPERVLYRIVSRLRFLPRWIAGTSTTGMSFLYDRLCCASEGYRQHFIDHGADPDKVVVTGIPNFDDCERYRRNDFPHRGYVLVCTSDTRETFKLESRTRLVRRAREIAAGRPLIFKLHPNEDEARETRVIRRIAPDALVLQKGSAEEMIANCEVLITQWSSTVFVGMALGKEVYSNFDLDEVRRLLPMQNGGTSAARIAEVCRGLLEGPRPRPHPKRPTFSWAVGG